MTKVVVVCGRVWSCVVVSWPCGWPECLAAWLPGGRGGWWPGGLVAWWPRAWWPGAVVTLFSSFIHLSLTRPVAPPPLCLESSPPPAAAMYISSKL